jgi:peptidoglycan-associated lipoprotein
MKSTKLTYLLVCALAMTMAATGCKKKPVRVTNLPGQPVGRPGGDEPRPLPEGGKLAGGETAMGGGSLPDDLNDLSRFNQDRATLAAHIVHFDYDSATVKANEKANVEAVAAYMKSTANVALLIEGHCDERGTEEYNRSLGERRALALREALATSGADASRITTRSFGEDKPVAMGHDESAWKQNRRGEFVVLHPK